MLCFCVEDDENRKRIHKYNFYQMWIFPSSFTLKVNILYIYILDPINH